MTHEKTTIIQITLSFNENEVNFERCIGCIELFMNRDLSKQAIKVMDVQEITDTVLQHRSTDTPFQDKQN